MTAKRIGTKDRELHAEHIRECYAGGYLNDEDLEKRLTKVYEAVTLNDLLELTADLPSQAELHGTPRRLRKALIGFHDLAEEHPVLTFVPMMILSALWAIIPSVVIGTHHLYGVAPLQVLGIFSVVTGVIGFFGSFAALMETVG